MQSLNFKWFRNLRWHTHDTSANQKLLFSPSVRISPRAFPWQRSFILENIISYSVTIGCLNEIFDLIMSGVVIFSAALVIIIFQMITFCSFRRHNNAVAQMMEDGGNQANSVSDQTAAAERELTKTTTYVVSLLGLLFIPMHDLFYYSRCYCAKKRCKVFGSLYNSSVYHKFSS